MYYVTKIVSTALLGGSWETVTNIMPEGEFFTNYAVVEAILKQQSETGWDTHAFTTSFEDGFEESSFFTHAVVDVSTGDLLLDWNA